MTKFIYTAYSSQLKIFWLLDIEKIVQTYYYTHSLHPERKGGKHNNVCTNIHARVAMPFIT